MPLSAGEKLGPYEILSPLGAGGMGEVYRARDSKLGRDVALKVLPGPLANDAHYMARFEREAHMLASLNHPNIAAIYGLEDTGQRAIVMEMVQGVTLAERIAAGPLPGQETLAIAKQIAEALEYAHEKGIIHRDLKPANVKITPEKVVKVLDFGLAKVFGPELAPAEWSHASTVAAGPTTAGAVLGTPSYMSPEQACGQPVDKRTDIWAFGCVLYEMFTGKRPFLGSTSSELLLAIQQREPEWDRLPKEVPAKIAELMRRCLAKDRKQRLHDIADARLEIEAALAERTAPVAPPPARSRTMIWIGGGLLAAVLGFLAWQQWRSSNPAASPVIRTTIALPPTHRLAVGSYPALAFSPNGTRLAYIAVPAGQAGGRRQLFLRSMDQFETTPMPGTEDASGPFFSPNGEWVGFFAASKLKKVPVRGGDPIVLCDAGDGRGATWGPDDTIIFARGSAYGVGLQRVPALGGNPETLTTPDTNNDETGHRWPEFLPGGKRILFTIWSSVGFGNARIAALDLQTGERRILVKGASDAHYSADGKLVFASLAGLMVAPFDAARLELKASPVRLLERFRASLVNGGTLVALGGPRLLAYVQGGVIAGNSQFVWVDDKGVSSPLGLARGSYFAPKLSPDGKRLVMALLEEANFDLWIYEMARGTMSRLTHDGSAEHYPVWTPDGKRIAYSSNKGGALNLYWRLADGSGSEERLATSRFHQGPDSWSPDGKVLAFDQASPTTSSDIWMLSMEGERKPRLFLQTPFNEGGAQFSPDGKWIAYNSDESGRNEIYVREFPRGGSKIQISVDGGTDPVWAHSGREMYYRNSREMMVVDTRLAPSFSVGRPRKLFASDDFVFPSVSSFDIAADARRFLMLQANPEPEPVEINVIQNWADEMRQRPAAGSK